MSQITLRQIPEPLERKLRQMAEEKRESLNKTIISVLQHSLYGENQGLPKKRRDIRAALHDGWSQAEFIDFKKNTAEFETIDDEMWR